MLDKKMFWLFRCCFCNYLVKLRRTFLRQQPAAICGRDVPVLVLQGRHFMLDFLSSCLFIFAGGAISWWQ